MKKYLLAFLSVFLCSPIQAGDKNTYKQDVSLWYEAFDKHDPAILDKILSENWYESPSEPGTKSLYENLTGRP